MCKSAFIAFAGMFLVLMVFCNPSSAVTPEEIIKTIAGYSDDQFTNGNVGIRESFLKSLRSISDNIALLNDETDQLFRTELKQETRQGIEELISRVDGCIGEVQTSLSVDDWLVDCQPRNNILNMLNELLSNY